MRALMIGDVVYTGRPRTESADMNRMAYKPSRVKRSWACEGILRKTRDGRGSPPWAGKTPPKPGTDDSVSLSAGCKCTSA